jgi:hypothetical protein
MLDHDFLLSSVLQHANFGDKASGVSEDGDRPSDEHRI